MGRIIIAIVFIALLVFIPSIVLADAEYISSEDGVVYAQVLNGDGSPANSANVTLTLWTSAGTKVLDSVNMTYITGSNGIYSYNLTSPETEGFYLAEICSTNPVAYSSGQIHVSAEEADAEVDPFGMPQVLFAVGFCIFAFWKRGWLRIILSICVVLWGMYALPYDIKIAAPLIGVGFVLFIIGVLRIIESYRQGDEQ